MWCSFAGDRFDLKEFHDAVLSCGQVPLNILADIVDRYIARTRCSGGDVTA